MRQIERGDQITMWYTRWAGRTGTVLGYVLIGGGYQSRVAIEVHLDATARGAERTIRCWESSFIVTGAG